MYIIENNVHFLGLFLNHNIEVYAEPKYHGERKSGE